MYDICKNNGSKEADTCQAEVYLKMGWAERTLAWQCGLTSWREVGHVL